MTARNKVVRVIDGDTIECGGVKMRLAGIDAPENGQPAVRNGRTFDAGQLATDALIGRLAGIGARGSALRLPSEGRGLVRLIEVGPAGVETDLNWWLVREGYAVAEYGSTQYRDTERRAEAEGRGLWGMTGWVRPKDYRAGRPTAPSPAAPSRRRRSGPLAGMLAGMRIDRKIARLLR